MEFWKEFKTRSYNFLQFPFLQMHVQSRWSRWTPLLILIGPLVYYQPHILLWFHIALIFNRMLNSELYSCVDNSTFYCDIHCIQRGFSVFHNKKYHILNLLLRPLCTWTITIIEMVRTTSAFTLCIQYLHTRNFLKLSVSSVSSFDADYSSSYSYSYLGLLLLR